jgi:hypothetical protein
VQEKIVVMKEFSRCMTDNTSSYLLSFVDLVFTFLNQETLEAKRNTAPLHLLTAVFIFETIYLFFSTLILNHYEYPNCGAS